MLVISKSSEKSCFVLAELQRFLLEERALNAVERVEMTCLQACLFKLGTWV